MLTTCCKKIIYASVGGSSVCLVTADGELIVWGDNVHGQLGLGDKTNRLSPNDVKIINSTWAKCSISDKHSLAIKSDGTLWAWGDNTRGQLGLGDTTERLSPVQVGTGTNWVHISAGGLTASDGHSLAIKSDGTLWAWGSNVYGQLGLGDTIATRLSPVQVGTGTNWVHISASYSHSLAIKSDGTLWAWGNSSNGQLGLGDTTTRLSPVQVGTGTNWVSAEGAFYPYSLAIKSDGTLWSWGYNLDGQLGLGDTTTRLSPVQVGTGTNWTFVARGGRSHSLAIKSDGTLWAWGSNVYGQFGDGTTTNSNVPKLIETTSMVEMAHSGTYFSLIIAK